MSRRPSGLAESPLFRMGLTLRLWEVEPAMLERLGFNRLGMMRTILDRRAKGRGVDDLNKGEQRSFQGWAASVVVGWLPWLPWLVARFFPFPRQTENLHHLQDQPNTR